MTGSKDQAKCFERYMRTWHNILSLLGLSPVACHVTEGGDVVYRVSPWRMIPSASIIALSACIIYVQVWDKEFDADNIGSTVISGYLNVIGNFVTCLNIASAVYNSKEYAALATSFLTFNRKSLTARVEAILKMSAKFISFFIALLCMSLCFGFFILEKDNDLISAFFLLNYVSELYNFLCVCQFAVCCFWIREYLSRVNGLVEKHSVLLRTQGISIYRKRMEFLKLNSVFPDGSPRVSSIQTTMESTVNKMKYVRRLYHQIYLISVRLNEVFSTRNLIIVSHNFFLGIILIYCGLSETVKYCNRKSSLTVLEIFNYFKLSVMSFLCIYGLIWPSTKVYSEVQATTTLVQEYFTTVPKGELQQELHSFVMQIFHENICFTPHGFFSLNNKLLLSIIGSVASYLVILVQFRISVI